MAIYHLSMRGVSRSSGGSATAKAAYISGTRLDDARLEKAQDYSRRARADEIKHTEIILPAGAPEHLRDRQHLWAAVEHSHRRKDSTTAREIEIALPHEIGDAARKRLTLDFARSIAERYGVAVDVAIHQPSKRGDERNHHAHLLCSTQAVDATKKHGFGRKVAAFDPIAAQRAGLPTPAEVLRPEWEERTNQALERAEVQECVDHRSHEARGLDALPTIHVGLGSDAAERAAENERRIGLNRQLAAVQETLSNLYDQAREWTRERIEDFKSALTDKVMEPLRRLTDHDVEKALEGADLSRLREEAIRYGPAAEQEVDQEDQKIERDRGWEIDL